MPIILPAGTFLTPGAGSADDTLAGPRITSWRCEVLSSVDESFLGVLDGVSDGSITWDAYAAIKSGGTLTINNIGPSLAWLNVLLRPVATLSLAGSPGVFEIPMGVYVPSAPTVGWSSTGSVTSVQMLDKSSWLDQDVPTSVTGKAVVYALPVGANVMAAIKSLISSVGGLVAGITPNAVALSVAMVWPEGTTKLKIVNDLLNSINYGSLWCDRRGQFVVAPYVPPAYRPPVYESLQPFVPGPTSLMTPNWTQTQDIYAIPNRVVAVGQGSGSTASLVSTVTNERPESPFSYQARGRWITTVDTGVSVVDQVSLDSYARKRLSSLSSVGRTQSVVHAFLPDLTVNSIVAFKNDPANVDTFFTVLKTTVSLSSSTLSTSDFQEVLTI